MPQNHRRVAFSGKAKKEQLKSKKHRFQETRNPVLLQEIEQGNYSRTQKLNSQPNKAGSSRQNRYALEFFRESDQEIRERKHLARNSLEFKEEKELEIDGMEYFTKEFDFPKRPAWSFDLTKAELEAKENRYFREYLKNVEQQFETKEVSYFELNLETWRQLWRVLEMSDILLFIVDIRYSALLFPPSLYEYVQQLNKDFILVLNKIDLAPAPLIVAWKNYFKEHFPKLHVVSFTSMPDYNLIGKTNRKGLQVRRRRGKTHMAAEGAQKLLDVCKSLVSQKVDLTDWQEKINEELKTENHGTEEESVQIQEKITLKEANTEFYEYVKFRDNILTIGCVGHPNVGKSSLLNALMGKKVVSVSKTPGHTKHFQTIFITKNVRLCDCPGLVFPSKVPKPLQVLMGSFPIAQLREPFSIVRFMAERMDLIGLLRLEHPDNDDSWSAMDICDSWAKKRGYLTAKAARLDSSRAANSILRMALDGKICLCFQPPNYQLKIDFWKQHPEIKEIEWIQAKNFDEEEQQFQVSPLESSEDELDEPNPTKNLQESSGEEDLEEISDQVNSNKFALLDSIE